MCCDCDRETFSAGVLDAIDQDWRKFGTRVLEVFNDVHYARELGSASVLASFVALFFSLQKLAKLLLWLPLMVLATAGGLLLVLFLQLLPFAAVILLWWFMFHWAQMALKPSPPPAPAPVSQPAEAELP